MEKIKINKKFQFKNDIFLLISIICALRDFGKELYLKNDIDQFSWLLLLAPFLGFIYLTKIALNYQKLITDSEFKEKVFSLSIYPIILSFATFLFRNEIVNSDVFAVLFIFFLYNIFCFIFYLKTNI